MRRGVPVVEVSDRGNLGGVGSPDRKVSSIDAIDADRMSAELFVESKMAPLVKEINVVIGQKRKIGSRRWRKPHSDYYLWTCWPDAMNCRHRSLRQRVSSRIVRMQNLKNPGDRNVDELRTVIELIAQLVSCLLQKMDIQQESQLIARFWQEWCLRGGIQIASQIRDRHPTVPKARPSSQPHGIFRPGSFTFQLYHRGVIEGAQHAGHVAQRRPLYTPLAERPRRLALKIYDDEVFSGK